MSLNGAVELDSSYWHQDVQLLRMVLKELSNVFQHEDRVAMVAKCASELGCLFNPMSKLLGMATE